MKELSQAQKNELVVWEYFVPTNCAWQKKRDEDIERFFEWSEEGKHKELLAIPTYKLEGRTYFHALVFGKKWAGIHIHELWEPDFLSGHWVGYLSLLGGLENKKEWWQFWKRPHLPVPRPVVDFLKKEMFKGTDAGLIESVYQKLLKENSFLSLLCFTE